MMESIALESNIAASAIIPNEDEYVMVEDSDDDDMMEIDEDDSYDMCDEEDDLLTSLSSPSPAPTFSTQELRDLETLVEGGEGPTPSIGIGTTSTTTNSSTNSETPAIRGRSRVVSIVSEEDAYRHDDDANAGVSPPALLSPRRSLHH